MSKPFEIDFTLLPPKLQAQLWLLALDADTGRVNIAYQNQTFITSAEYHYGGNIDAALSIRRFTIKAGVNPGNGDLDLGLVFKGFKFGTTASFTRGSFGIDLGYGDSLLPFPDALADTFNSAEHGLQSVVADISAAPNNPLAWYKTHSNDTKVIGKAVSAGQLIAKQGTPGDHFGAGLRLSYTPLTGLTIYGGAQFRF